MIKSRALGPRIRVMLNRCGPKEIQKASASSKSPAFHQMRKRGRKRRNMTLNEGNAGRVGRDGGEKAGGECPECCRVLTSRTLNLQDGTGQMKVSQRNLRPRKMCRQ